MARMEVHVACLRKHDNLLHLLLVALLLDLSHRVLSVAPDDFSSACDLFAEPYKPYEKLLMDTQYYESTTLLGDQGEDRLWLSIDFDGTAGDSIEKWEDQSQTNFCMHKLSVCGYQAGDQDNWMVTQYINISRMGVTELALSVSFTLVSGTECMGGCSESVGVRIYETNEPDEDNRSNPAGYSENLATLVNINETSIMQIITLQFIPISGSSTGLYLAVVDTPPGSCITITRLILYYYICPEQKVNLVKYPELIAPTNENVQDILVAATCMPNAMLTSTENMLECKLRGQWEANAIACSCEEGHYFVNDSSVLSCVACPPGTYKDAVGNAVNCDVCPSKSNATSPGSAKCPCIDGYYRNMDEATDVACTALLTGAAAPESVQIDGHVLSWQLPIDIHGELVAFQIVFTFDSTSITIINPLVFGVSETETSADLFQFKLAAGMYSVQVRAVTTIGPGMLSDPISYIEDGTDCSLVAGVSVSSTFLVTAVLSSLLTLLVTWCLCAHWREKKTTPTGLDPLYDIPITGFEKDILKVSPNSAYGHVQQQCTVQSMIYDNVDL